MEVSPDEVADLVLNTFDGLEKKRKPLARESGVKEWVPLSGIVAQRNDGLKCLAIATGMKCLPQNKISQAQGVVLHDWHAEILAIRLFNRFLLEECHALALEEKKSSDYVRFRSQNEKTESHFQPFALNDGINLHMYCSEAPCGDSSMELTMALQEDSTPWTPPPQPTTSLPSDTTQPLLHGRSYFSSLGQVRRKPSRPDAPPTLSKSCTDKLCVKQCTSLLSGPVSLLISPQNIYIHSLILPSTQLSLPAVARAFSPVGRMAPIADQGLEKKADWGKAGYAFKPFTVLPINREFRHSRRQPLLPGESLTSSNISAAWTPRFSETLIGGTIQGRKQFSVKGASRVCKRRSWKLALDIVRILGEKRLESALSRATYKEVKEGELGEERRKVKQEVREVLGGWVRNDGGEAFGVDGVDI